MKHTLHIIGWMGTKHAYLDIPGDEAENRYLAENPTDLEGAAEHKVIHFDDSFGCYDAWEL